MPPPRMTPPQPAKTGCKPPVLVSASNILKMNMLDEEVKMAVNIALDRFHCSTQRDGSQGKNKSGRLNNGVPQVPQSMSSSTLDGQHHSLPVFAYREQILQLVKDSSVVVVVGETGSGKTTQDEVHERDGLTDFLLTKLKEVVQKIPTLKLLLFSAALDIDVFKRYFTSCQVINVQRTMFDVEQLFLEDIDLISFEGEVVNPNMKTQGAEAVSLDLQKEADAYISNICANNDPRTFLLHLFNLILNKNLSVDYRHSQTSVTPLMVAAGQGFLTQMKELLNIGATIPLTDSNGWNALDWAKHFQQKVAEDLLKSYM
ncbi:hypothetical protein NHX12_004248 [Muraenolepis orangiensis]|uniref:Uncharacterized protein n=1 Tax=Muraenolepis orangiensis TaxID=630683 RepID=A0A9Q0IEG3_9TELE|nr:hypothetical protein NHX12_004248 [Muraenolepis orangiensis]